MKRRNKTIAYIKKFGVKIGDIGFAHREHRSVKGKRYLNPAARNDKPGKSERLKVVRKKIEKFDEKNERIFIHS